MATDTRQYTGRETHYPHIHFLRKTIVFGDDGSTLDVGILPVGATILLPISGVKVDTAFDGDTTNTVDIGVSAATGGVTADTDKYATALALGTVAFVTLDVTAIAHTMTAETTITCTVTSTASATAGSGEVIIAYVPDTDG